jgi:hypothetical protein
MTSVDAEPKGLAEVLCLANELAEQVLALQVMQRSIPENQLVALVSAARFLHENEVAWPPLVQEVVQEIAAKMEAIRSEPAGDEVAS